MRRMCSRAVAATIAATDYGTKPTVLAKAEFEQAPDISFDYAVMEKAEQRAVVRADFDWSDVGSWDALAISTPPDAAGNRVPWRARSSSTRASATSRAEDRVVAAVGVENLLVVDTSDALLVANATARRK